MFQLIRTDPPADQVRRIIFVRFLADGRCVLTEDPGGPALPAGEVQDGEDYVLDAVLRVTAADGGLPLSRMPHQPPAPAPHPNPPPGPRQ